MWEKISARSETEIDKSVTKGAKSREALTQSGDLLQCGWCDTCSAGWEPPPRTHAARGLVSNAQPPSPCSRHPAGQSHTGGSLTHAHTHTHTRHISWGIKGTAAYKRQHTLLGLCRRLLLFCSQYLISLCAHCLIVSLKRAERTLPKYAYQA